MFSFCKKLHFLKCSNEFYWLNFCPYHISIESNINKIIIYKVKFRQLTFCTPIFIRDRIV